MSLLFYNIFLWFSRVGIHIASLFNPKAKKWVAGRKRVMQRLAEAIPANELIVWVHCASLGEFEQGRPVMEELKKKWPAYKILLTFFSPSGYEAQKNYKGADWIFYLPMDGPRTAKRFLEIVHPSLVIFVKYEFWFYYLKKIKYRQIPLLLISALFRRDMSFFKWYGGLQQKMLARFDRLFVQNESSKKLLDDIGLEQITTVSGDTRFDRVVAIAAKNDSLPLIEQFIGNDKAIIAGSTWQEDENVLKQLEPLLADHSLKLVLAPHEIDQPHKQQLRDRFEDAVLYSELANGTGRSTAPVLIIDNIGMLSRLYKYAFIAFIGGGYIKMGVHNVLEPAVYGKPVLMGPFYKKYYEAIGLVNAGGGIPVGDGTELVEKIKNLIADKAAYSNAAIASSQYVREHAGATKRIIDYIQTNRLLIN